MAGERALAAAFDKGGAERVTRLYRRDDLPEDQCWLRALASLVTPPLTGKDRDPGDPAREKFRAPSLDPEDGPMPNVAVRKSVRGQR